ALGHALRLEISAVEPAGAADVRVVHQAPVHPFEVEGEPDGLAHAHILELLAPRVDPVALEVAGVPGRQLGADQLAGVELLADVDARPFARGKGADVIELAGLERL